ncbi:hypothetical protein L1987_16640 [Smallanthus sonchifolius]|uniref:Uncharacterized protein n=1 Tax=Smallanthus sonchifolius TaxID=185202 RepID=A0ACB9IV09_9ASTR|nr:hypothetical protein L1987_16640 [Smallanthus sonchifolius]
MILIITFVSVFLSRPPLLHSATYANTSKPICPESFSCPDFGPFKFPFYNTTDTKCGLIKVNCTSGNESIRLGGQSYKITGKDSPGLWVNIQNSKKLVDTNNCEALMNNFTSPTPRLFSISITSLMALFKCPKDLDYAAKFDQSNYNSYNRCKDHNFYYMHPISSTSVPRDLPHGCQVIQLPGRVQTVNGHVPNYNDIFSLLASQFSVSFWSPSCYDQCYEKGHCHPNHEDFQCSDAKKGKLVKKRALILELSVGVATLCVGAVTLLIIIISDFGLAKLFLEKRSMISMSCMRGTPGYIAPELFSRSFDQVSHKSDVYSYGMMILEMVGGRRNVEIEVDHTSEIYFPHWIYKKVELEEEQLGLHGIVSDEENEMAMKMIIVGLWCIQTNPLNRPAITKVLEMLEGGLELLEIPPKPYMWSP